MERVLEKDVKHQCCQKLIIRQSHKFLDNQGAYLNIHRRIGAGVFVAVKDGIRRFVYLGEDIVRELFCPRLFKELFSRSVRLL